MPPRTAKQQGQLLHCQRPPMRSWRWADGILPLPGCVCVCSVLAFGTVRSDGTLIANKWEVTKVRGSGPGVVG